MRRACWLCGLWVLGLLGSSPAEAQDGAFNGEWRTVFGTVTIAQKGDDVTGTYGNANQFTLKGKAVGKVLSYDYAEENAKGEAKWTLDDTGQAFTGRFQIKGGRNGAWNGWKPDPEASKGDPAKFAGQWLTSFGLMELVQDGAKVKGRYAIRGTSDIEGDVTGRHFEYRYKGMAGGKGWFDLAADGKTISGAAQGDGAFGWYGWQGRPAPEFIRNVPLKAGKTLDGSVHNLLTYSIRAPEGYDPKDGKKWPAVVILHGSNMNGRSYVETIASAWPDIARDFILIGINGETPSSTGPDPRFNFSYVSFVGKSTYKGYPGTDRESPALVAEALDELKAMYPVGKFLVGGHSQGGFLTYSLLMNYPDKVAGAFPISAGLIFQCEPSAYADEDLKKVQRRTPLVIIHGKTDPVVGFGMGKYAADAFREASWQAFRFLEPAQGGHMFALLPVNEAIRWLDALTPYDHEKLVEFAESKAKAGEYRDAIAAYEMRTHFKPRQDLSERMDKVGEAIDAQAGPKAKDFLAKIKAGQDGWIDDFLNFRDQFEFAGASKDVMAAFNDLRGQQSKPAQTLFNEARGLFQNGKADEGYKKYQQMVDQYPTSPLYRTVKGALAERK